MQATLYISGTRFLLTDEEPLKISGGDHEFVMEYPTRSELEARVKLARRNVDNTPVRIITLEITETLEHIRALFHEVEAAGGLVQQGSAKWLMIYRNQYWDLPKGKVEPGESLRDAALREVEEECGIEGLTIVAALPPTYHSYQVGEKKFFKTTYWFHMESDRDMVLVPQLEEGIELAQWLSRSEISKISKRMYPSIADVLRNAKILNGH